MPVPLPITAGVCVADAVKCKATQRNKSASEGGTMRLATRRHVLAGLGVAAAAAAAKSARAQEKLRVGVLRLASSPPAFLAFGRGSFPPPELFRHGGTF